MNRLILLLLLTLLTGITGCATNPVTGKSELSFVSENQEIAIGEQQYVPTQQSQGGLYKVDAALTDYVQQVGNRLAAVSDRDLPYEFVVINDSTPNAWALPGGKIAVNRGLLTQLDNEAELAAVLGHEIVHAAARHGAQSMERNMLMQGAIMLTAIGASDSEYGNYIMGGASIGAQLLSQRYGRGAELESDYYGMTYMVRAGYDPDAAVTLQEKFVALQNGRSSSWLEGLFASHPPSEERVMKNAETSAALKAAHTGDLVLGRAPYQQQLKYLASREEAYRAFDQARTLAADGEYDVALSRINKAIALEPREARFYGQKAGIELSKKNYQAAISDYTEALARDPEYYNYYLGRGLSYSRLGDRESARSDLTRSNSLLPTATATNELGQLSLLAGDRDSAKNYFAQVASAGGALADAARQNYINLDLEDNPDKYFEAQSSLRKGQFYSQITNRSGLRISSALVDFEATINGEPVRRQLRTGALEAGASRGLYPGWPLTASDTIDNVRVRVIDVKR